MNFNIAPTYTSVNHNHTHIHYNLDLNPIIILSILTILTLIIITVSMCQAKLRFCEFCHHSEQTPAIPSGGPSEQEQAVSPFALGACPFVLQGCPSISSWHEEQDRKQQGEERAAELQQAAKARKKQWVDEYFSKHQISRSEAHEVSFLRSIMPDGVKNDDEVYESDTESGSGSSSGSGSGVGTGTETDVTIYTSSSSEVDIKKSVSMIDPIQSVDDVDFSMQIVEISEIQIEHPVIAAKMTPITIDTTSEIKEQKKTKGRFGVRAFGSKLKKDVKNGIKESIEKSIKKSINKMSIKKMPAATTPTPPTSDIASTPSPVLDVAIPEPIVLTEPAALPEPVVVSEPVVLPESPNPKEHQDDNTNNIHNAPFTITDDMSKKAPAPTQTLDEQPDDDVPFDIDELLDDFKRNLRKVQRRRKNRAGPPIFQQTQTREMPTTKSNDIQKNDSSFAIFEDSTAMPIADANKNKDDVQHDDFDSNILAESRDVETAQRDETPSEHEVSINTIAAMDGDFKPSFRDIYGFDYDDASSDITVIINRDAAEWETVIHSDGNDDIANLADLDDMDCDDLYDAYDEMDKTIEDSGLVCHEWKHPLFFPDEYDEVSSTESDSPNTSDEEHHRQQMQQLDEQKQQDQLSPATSRSDHSSSPDPNIKPRPALPPTITTTATDELPRDLPTAPKATNVVTIGRFQYACAQDISLAHPRPLRNLNPIIGFDMNGSDDNDDQRNFSYAPYEHLRFQHILQQQELMQQRQKREYDALVKKQVRDQELLEDFHRLEMEALQTTHLEEQLEDCDADMDDLESDFTASGYASGPQQNHQPVQRLPTHLDNLDDCF